MRLPRIPRLGKRGQQQQTGPKRKDASLRLILGGLLLLLVSFVISFYLFFPAAALKDRIEREVGTRTPVHLQINRLSLRFPPGLDGRGVEVLTPNPRLKKIAISDLEVSPLWTSLFSGNPGLSLDADLFGGTLTGSVRRSGLVAARAHQISFNESLLPKSKLAISGVLNEGSYSGTLPPRAQSATQLQLSLGTVKLTGLKPFGAASDTLDLGRITLIGKGRGNSFRIDKFEAAGGDLQISGGGTVLLVTPMDRSRLNLRVVLRPGPHFDNNLRGLLNLVTKPGRDGVYRFRLTGSLARPSVH